VGVTEQAGINLKYRTPACKQYPYNTFVPQDQQEEKSIGVTQGVEEIKTLSGKPTIIQNTTRIEVKRKSRKQIKTIKIEYINEHIFGTIKKTMGL
jgi:hypothetical protein